MSSSEKYIDERVSEIQSASFDREMCSINDLDYPDIIKKVISDTKNSIKKEFESEEDALELATRWTLAGILDNIENTEVTL